MNINKVQLLGLCGALAVMTNSLADTTYVAKSSESISGNPIKRQENYTINSTQRVTLAVLCIFENRGAQPAELNVWTSPHQTHPIRVIRLAPGTQSDPSRDHQTFYLNLNNLWWCQIYPPATKENWKFCHYFSISDATISQYYPFNTWNKTIHSKKTFYSCKIERVRPDAPVRFYYFKQL